MPSLYAQYIKEREGFESVEVEHGFATYIQVDPDTVYLRDIFVEEGFRKQGIASELSKMVMDISRILGAKRLTGSVCTDAKGVTVSMKALLADGFTFSHALGNMLYFAKEVKNG